MAGLNMFAVLGHIYVCVFLLVFSALEVLTELPPEQTIGNAAEEVGANRKLLALAGCSVDYTTLDYSPVTSECKSPYPEGVCCKAYNDFCAPYKSELNDLSKMCAMFFTAYLNMAGTYENGVFLGRCNSGSNVCN